MITLESVFSKKNQARAMEKMQKHSDENFVEYWELNRERICMEVQNGNYVPGAIPEYEIVNGKGKRRTVINMSQTDRFITRLLAQKLSDFFEPLFLENCFAYRREKGAARAIEAVQKYVAEGNEYVVEIDVKNFFDEISIERMCEILKRFITDKRVVNLMRSFFYCTLLKDGEHYCKEKGLLQGCSMSPVLSNLYLLDLDCYMEERGYHWMRFADNIYLFVPQLAMGTDFFSTVTGKLDRDFNLPINQSKSGVFSAYEHRILGYDIHKKKSGIEVVKHVYQKQNSYHNWHECAVEKINREYHIVQGGVLNKRDYALLFENGEEKHHIPVETTEQLNLYNEVMISSAVIQTLSQNGIRLAFFDKHGDALGYFVPENYVKDAKTLLQQCLIYADDKKRLQMARRMEIAAIHNIRANMRYYNKHQKGELADIIESLSIGIKELNECKSVEELLLIEARCRQIYYMTFNRILKDERFFFYKRTRRPPEDEINALISFGNTLLYNQIQQIIWKTSLDSRIGIFHAANRRHYSLNLDFADLFKPIIVDRVIFSMINRHQLEEESFEHKEDESVYLSEKGKRLFVESFEQKLKTKISLDGKELTYLGLLEREVRRYQKYVTEGSNYKPYKYY